MVIFIIIFNSFQIPRIFYWITLRRNQNKFPAIVSSIYQDGISAVHASQDFVSRERMEQLYKDL
jgi:hypothetical protein